MYSILVAQPPIISIGVGDDVRVEHVISNSRRHTPPPFSNTSHPRHIGSPASEGSQRWPPVQARGRLWTPAFAGERRNLVEVVYPGGIASGDLGLLLFGAARQNLLNDLVTPGEGGLDMRVI